MIRWLSLPLFASLAVAARVQDEPLQATDLLLLVDMKRPDDEIIRLAKQRRLAFRLDEAIEAAFAQKGVSPTVLRAIQEIQLVDDLLARAGRGKDEFESVKLLAERGIFLDLTSEDLLFLNRKKLPQSLLAALQGRIEIPEYRRYEHAGGRFRVQFPPDWKSAEEFRDTVILVGFAPKSDAAADAAFRVELQILGADAPRASLALDRVLRARMQEMKTEAQSRGETLEVRGAPVAVRLQGLPALEVEWDGKRGEATRRNRALLFHHDGVEYWLVRQAPVARFADLQREFDRMLVTFVPSLQPWGRPERRPTANSVQIVETYKESVVRVHVEGKTDRGSIAGVGTGWFVRSDGYLFTNWHVATMSGELKRLEKLEIEWDVTLNRPRLEAQLIGHVHTEYPAVDVALLKVSGTNFRPLPVTRTSPPGARVKEQDRIIVLGFPAITDSTNPNADLTLTTTDGTISRFILKGDGNTEKFYHTASTSGGNSGGPIFDLETHSVIGLHTWSPYEPRAKEQGVKVSAIGYGIGCVVDAALESFPEVLAYPRSGSAGLRPEDHLSLARQFAQQGLCLGAQRQIEKALEARPDWPEAMACAGDIARGLGEESQAIGWYEKALKADRNCVPALLGAARVDPTAALGHYSRAIELRPGEGRAYLGRARIYAQAGQGNEALQDARKAIELSGDVDPEGYRILGEIQYARGQLEEGRQAYRRALEIDPRDVEARLGEIDFDARSGQVPAAVEKVDAIAEKEKRRVSAQRACADYLWGLAQRLKESRRTADADLCFLRAYDRYGLLFQIALKGHASLDKTLCLRVAWLAKAIRKDAETAEAAYDEATWLLARFENGRRIDDDDLQLVYYNLGLLLSARKKDALAEGFFQAAGNLSKATALAKLAAEQVPPTRTRVSVEDAKYLNDNVNFFTAEDVLMAGPIGFTVDEEALKKRGIRPFLISVLKKAAQKSYASKNAPAAVAETEDVLDRWVEKDAELVRTAQGLSPERVVEVYREAEQAVQSRNHRLALDTYRMIFYRTRFESGALADYKGKSAQRVCEEYCLERATEDALDWFQFAVAAGQFDYNEEAIKSSLLDAIRFEPRFKKILDKVGGSGGLGRQGNPIRSMLGVKLAPLSAAERNKLGIPREDMGLRVAEVYPGSPGARAEVQSGDVLCRFEENVIVLSRQQLADWLTTQRPGDKISVVVNRGGEWIVKEIRLGSPK